MRSESEGIMRNLLLSFMLLIGGVAYAGVTGEVVGYAPDANGNIVVKVAYEIDGVQVESPYPKENGRFIQVFRLAYTNIDGMTQEQVAAYIDSNVKQHCESLLQRKANAVENAKLDLSPFVGRKVTVESMEMNVSETKAIVLSTAGKQSEKVLTPTVYIDPVQAKLDEIKASLAKIDTATSIEAVK